MSSVQSSTEDDSSSSSSSTAPKAKRQKATPFIPAPLEIIPKGNTANAIKNPRKIIILLDQARLETVKSKKGDFELLNCDDHRELCKKFKRDPSELRPDICHQELLALIDSPLNKAGYLQVYIRTHKGILIEIHPSVRVPRTFKRFSGLMVQLLHKMKIKASSNSTTLLKVIKNPFSQYLPAGTRVYGMSCKGSTLYSPYALATNLIPPDKDSASSPPVCFIIGAMASGHVSQEEHPYMEKLVSISKYPLSGAAAISRILSAIENHWEIV
mmetsp:Transcript_6737/g.9783  ORF Transcript_6737/g.9783 Transcript_6737/m.9783 type:complete len:270 (-) Transcript_6737:47-856(-)